MAQTMRQIKPREMTKPLKEKIVQPSIVLPTMQLVAQAESEFKHQKNETPIFESIKATPQFESSKSSPSTIKWNTWKCKAQSHPEGKSQTRRQRHLLSLETYSTNHGKNV